MGWYAHEHDKVPRTKGEMHLRSRMTHDETGPPAGKEQRAEEEPPAPTASTPAGAPRSAPAPRHGSDEGRPEDDDEGWNRHYQLLRQYWVKHGDCDVPPSYAVGDIQLGAWVAAERAKYRGGTLPPRRKRLLHAMNFSWMGNRSTRTRKSWSEQYENLRHYRRAHGHCNVSRKVHSDATLSAWVSHQRQCYKRGKLSDIRRKLLEEIGFCWVGSRGRQPPNAWNEQHQKLKQYQRGHGHCNVPQNRKGDDVNLGAWVNSQRQGCKRGEISEPRTTLLDDTGFMSRPVSAVDKNNSASKGVTGKSQDEEAKCHSDATLSAWVNSQRQSYERGEISEQRKTLLDDIGFMSRPVGAVGNSNSASKVDSGKRQDEEAGASPNVEPTSSHGPSLQQMRQTEEGEARKRIMALVHSKVLSKHTAMVHQSALSSVHR